MPDRVSSKFWRIGAYLKVHKITFIVSYVLFLFGPLIAYSLGGVLQKYWPREILEYFDMIFSPLLPALILSLLMAIYIQNQQ